MRVNNSSLLQGGLGGEEVWATFLHFDAIPSCPPVMNLMVRVGIAYMYSIDCAKDTTNFSSFLLGAQSLCSLCVFYLIYNSNPGWSQHSECSFNEDKNRSWN